MWGTLCWLIISLKGWAISHCKKWQTKRSEPSGNKSSRQKSLRFPPFPQKAGTHTKNPSKSHKAPEYRRKRHKTPPKKMRKSTWENAPIPCGKWPKKRTKRKPSKTSKIRQFSKTMNRTNKWAQRRESILRPKIGYQRKNRTRRNLVWRKMNPRKRKIQ